MKKLKYFLKNLHFSIDFLKIIAYNINVIREKRNLYERFK